MKPAKSLKIENLREGSGRTAKLGDVVHLRCLCRFTRGEVLFSSEDNSPYQVRLGARDAFVALEQGAIGMSLGGIRKVKAPPNLTYLERNVYPGLSENAVLHYEIELLEIADTWDSTLHIRCSPIYSESTKELERRYRTLSPTTDPDSEFQILQKQLHDQEKQEREPHHEP